MAQRFEIRIVQRKAWFFYTLLDRQTSTSYPSLKPYNSKGAAKEAAILLADSITDEFNEEVHDYGPML